MRSKLVTFAKMAPSRRALVMEAAATLAVARVWLMVSPFRVVAAHLGTPALPGADVTGDLASDQLHAVREIRWAMRLASKRVPFRALCLQQAVAAKLMLGRRGIPATVTFGLAPHDDPHEKLRAHAWVTSGRVGVSGFPVDEDLVPVARFA